MKKATLLVIAAVIILHTRVSAQNTEGYLSNNLGQIVEVANPDGIMPQTRILIGWDSTGYLRQSNSQNTYKIFGYEPKNTWLNNDQGVYTLNMANHFGSPGGNDGYEIRFGFDSSRYWIIGGTLAPDQAPFSVYHVGPKHSTDTSITGGIKLCMGIWDDDSNGVYTPGERIHFYSDRALPLDSTYDSLSTRLNNPFNYTMRVISELRFGSGSVPYTQSGFRIPEDGVIPPAGTVIRFVAKSADSIPPVVQLYSLQAPNAGVQYRFPVPVYSFESPTLLLEDAPPAMILSNDTILWTITASQFGQSYPFRIRATNSAGYSYQSCTAKAGYLSGSDLVNLRNNQIDYWTSNTGSFAYNFSETMPGFRWVNDPAILYFATGLYLGGKKQGTGGNPDTISVTHTEFTPKYELDAGRILNNGPFGSLTVENPDTSAAKVFVLPEHSGIWPLEAPHDELGNPLKLSARDTWTVFNDVWARTRNTDQFSLSPGFGIECQRQTFQFLEYPFDQSVLVRLRMINKSDATYDSCFFGLWADPDVGLESSDDLSIVDSTLPCLMTYSNPTGSDQSTSATGMLVIQSPVTAGNVNDTVTVIEIGSQGFEQKRKAGKIYAIPASAVSYRGGVGSPTGANGRGDLTRYWYLIGHDYLGGWKPNGRFDVTVSGTTPGDQRQIMGVGPYTFLPNDTQEVWYALMGAKGTTKGNAVDSILNHAYLMKEIFTAT